MIKFRLKHPNQERSSIQMRVSVRGHRFDIATGISALVADWNPRTQRIRQRSSNSDTAVLENEILDKNEAAAKRAIAKLADSLRAPSADEFREVFNIEYRGAITINKDIPLFLDYMQEYIERYRATKSYTTTRSITTIYNKLCKYEEETRRKITFESIDMLFYVELSTYFTKLGYRDTYFATAIKVIKQVYREAREVDKLHTLTGIDSKGFTSSCGEVDNIYLNQNELKRIHDLEITLKSIQPYYPESRDSDLARKVESLNRARAFFLLGANTALRISDVRRLKDADISDRIRIRTLKTNKEVVIPINSVVREILASGIDITNPPSEQKLNNAIKEIGRLSGLTQKIIISRKVGGRIIAEHKEKWELLTTHTARRSFATNAYKEGVPTIAIMQITGHTKESTFMKYIKVRNEENAEILQSHPFFQ